MCVKKSEFVEYVCVYVCVYVCEYVYVPNNWLTSHWDFVYSSLSLSLLYTHTLSYIHLYSIILSKAMRKTGFSGFLCFAKDERYFFSYSNLDPKIHSASILAKISRNKCGSKCETRIHENDSKILEVRNHCTKIFKFACQKPKNVDAVNWPPSIGLN